MSLTRRRQCLAVNLPVGRLRQRRQHHKRCGYHVVRQSFCGLPLQLRYGDLSPRHHIRDDPPVARLIFPHQHHTLRDCGLCSQHRLDLAQLDPVPAHLHLEVDPAQALNGASMHHAGKVARPVHAPAQYKGVHDEALRSHLGPVPVTSRHAIAADV